MKIPNDPFVKELLPEFVDSWLDDINNQYDNLILNKNSEDLYRMAHTLKGSCFQFGLDEVAELGIELMNYAKSNDWARANHMKDQIIGHFKKVKELLSASQI